MNPLMASKLRMSNHKLKMVLVVLLSLMLIIGTVIGLLIGLNHKPNNPKLPIFQIQSFSATTLSNSNSIPAIWNLTLSVTNPNPKHHSTLVISILSFTPFYYPSSRKNDTERVQLVNPVVIIPSMLEVHPKCTIVLSSLLFTISSNTLKVPIATDQLIKDQATGKVDAGFDGVVSFWYNNKAKNAMGKVVSSPSVFTIAGFQNQGGAGFVSQLPTSLLLFDLPH